MYNIGGCTLSYRPVSLWVFISIFKRENLLKVTLFHVAGCYGF